MRVSEETGAWDQKPNVCLPWARCCAEPRDVLSALRSFHIQPRKQKWDQTNNCDRATWVLPQSAQQTVRTDMRAFCCEVHKGLRTSLSWRVNRGPQAEKGRQEV